MIVLCCVNLPDMIRNPCQQKKAPRIFQAAIGTNNGSIPRSLKS